MEIDERRLGAGIVTLLSVVFMVVGLIGMGICFIFIWSSSDVDVTGAGMGFICGSILMGSGLLSLAVTLAGRQGRAEPVAK